jgi:hypothetical protein
MGTGWYGKTTAMTTVIFICWNFYGDEIIDSYDQNPDSVL